MTRISSLSIATGLALLMGSAALPAFAESAAYDLGAFTRADIGSALTVDIVVGGPQSIVAEANSPTGLEDLRVEVINGELRVWLQRDFWDFVSFNDPAVKLTISVPELTGLEAAAASSVTASGMNGTSVIVEAASASRLVLKDVNAKTMHVNASSAALLGMTGVCEAAFVNIASAAVLSGKGFECVDLTIEASSASQALLFASGDVVANVSSGARVELAGHPKHVDDEVASGADIDVLR